MRSTVSATRAVDVMWDKMWSTACATIECAHFTVRIDIIMKRPPCCCWTSECDPCMVRTRSPPPQHFQLIFNGAVQTVGYPVSAGCAALCVLSGVCLPWRVSLKPRGYRYGTAVARRPVGRCGVEPNTRVVWQDGAAPYCHVIGALHTEDTTDPGTTEYATSPVGGADREKLGCGPRCRPVFFAGTVLATAGRMEFGDSHHLV